MPAGTRRDRGSRRGFDHAHRIRQPVGSVAERQSTIERSPGRARPGSGAILAVVLVAVLALILRPWNVTPGSSGAPAPTSVAAAATALAPVTISTEPPASIGPHGDGVTGPEPTAVATPAPTDPRHPSAEEPPPAPLLAGYHWPLRNARITNSFGAGRPSSFTLDGQPFHDGLDIASFCGARIIAAHDGVVLGAGRRTQGLMGWVGDLTAFRAKLEAKDAWGTQAISVVIDDGNGYRSIYAHLGLATVEKGDTVEAGDLIGWEGASGNATGCHLHYAIFNPDETATLALDPKIAKKNKLPPYQIARIDPLLVLPPPASADVTWGWGAR